MNIMWTQGHPINAPQKWYRYRTKEEANSKKWEERHCPLIEEPLDTVTPDELARDRELISHMYRALGELSKKRTLVFRMRLQGHTLQETAMAVGLSRDRVRIMNNQTFRMLVRKLKDRYNGDENMRNEVNWW